jgi:hypothetical protein
MKQQLLIKQ